MKPLNMNPVSGAFWLFLKELVGVTNVGAVRV